MEESMAVQLHALREEQQRLERLLGHTALGLACDPAPSAGHPGSVQHRCVRELSASEANAAATTSAARQTTLGAGTTNTKNSDETLLAGHRTQWSYQDRLQELESLKRKYEAYARTSVSQYFNAVGDFQGYQERRASRMKHVQPFTFADREATRAPRIREHRAEADRKARTAALEERQRHPLKARPVPPSTFMNKYELMVEEWCQRKAAIELMAREQARRAKEEAAYVRLSAQSLRKTREELMGAVYDADGNPVSRSAQRQRAQSAEVARRSGAATVPPAAEVPLEVRMKLWPALSDHERVRAERIKYRAALRKMEVDEEVRLALPLLTSPTPGRCYDAATAASMVNAAVLQAASGAGGGGTACFGIGQPINTTATATAAAAAAMPGVAAPPPAAAAPAPPVPSGPAPGVPPAASVPVPPPPAAVPVPTASTVPLPPPPSLPPAPLPPAPVPAAAAVPASSSPAPHQSLSILSTSAASTPPVNVGTAAAPLAPPPAAVPSTSPATASPPLSAPPLLSLAPSSVVSPASPLPPPPSALPATAPPQFPAATAATSAAVPPSGAAAPLPSLPPVVSVPAAPATAGAEVPPSAAAVSAPPVPGGGSVAGTAAAAATAGPPAPAALPPTPPAGTASAVPPAAAPSLSPAAGAAATAASSATAHGDEREVLWRRYNPQLTFKPNVRPGVPNYEAIWAKDRVELSEKKKKAAARTTSPKPFDLTPSPRAEKVVGRRPNRSVSAAQRAPRPRSVSSASKSATTKGGAAAGARKQRSPSPPSVNDTRGPPSSPPAAAAAKVSRSAAPRGTRAHALRTEAIYSHYVKDAEQHDRVAEEDQLYWRAVAQRQREVRQRLAGYLSDHHAEHERAIQAKVRALRAAMKENELAAEERLAEMKQRVAAMPPVFAEPVHLHEESKVRAEVEQSILQSLKDTGLDGATIKNILATSAANTEGAEKAEGATGAAADAAATAGGAAGTEEPPTVDTDKKTEAKASDVENKKKKTKSGSESDSSSSTDSDSSSRSSSSSSSTSSSDSDSDSSNGGKVASAKAGSSAAVRSTSLSVPSAASLPVPKPVVTPKKEAEYSDDSFEDSTDSD